MGIELRFVILAGKGVAMPRRESMYIAGMVYHAVQQVNSRETCF